MGGLAYDTYIDIKYNIVYSRLLFRFYLFFYFILFYFVLSNVHDYNILYEIISLAI